MTDSMDQPPAPERSTSRPPFPEVEHIPVAEMTIDALNARVGDIDPRTGLPLTRLEEMKRQEVEEHGGRLFIDMNKFLSKSAARANKVIHENRFKVGVTTGGLIMAVVAVRRKQKHKS